MSELFCYVYKDHGETELPGLSRQAEETPSTDSSLDEEVFNMAPALRPQSKLLSLDDKLLLNMARANFLSQITVSSPA